MKALAWQPGTAMRLLVRIFSRWRRPGRLAVVGAEGGAGVDDAGVRVGHQGHRLARGVGQAEEGDVGGIEEACALLRVLALVIGDAQQLDIGTAGQVVEQTEAGGAFLTIYEHFETMADSLGQTNEAGRAL